MILSGGISCNQRVPIQFLKLKSLRGSVNDVKLIRDFGFKSSVTELTLLDSLYLSVYLSWETPNIYCFSVWHTDVLRDEQTDRQTDMMNLKEICLLPFEKSGQ